MKNDYVIATGGDLLPETLLSAYMQGFFPWYNDDEPILWHSPDPRMVIFPEKLHISHSMQKILDKNIFTVTINRDFASVICNCAGIERPRQGGTWINGDIIAAYTELHRLGFAVSAESWLEGNLVGGCYGILLASKKCQRKAFFGESMFSRTPNASKAAFLTLAQKLFAGGAAFIDCQVPTEHLYSLGGELISRKKFLQLLRETVG